MLHGNRKSEQQIYLSEKKNGHWTLFRDIIDLSDYSYFNFTPSFSFDNSKLYLSDKTKPENVLYTYTNTQSFEGVEKHNLKGFNFIEDVIGIGNQSILVRGQRVKGKPVAWYFLKQLQNGQWSVPSRVRELDEKKSMSIYGLTITPFDDIMLFTNFMSGELYLIKTPAIIKEELVKARNAQMTPANRVSEYRNDSKNSVSPNNVVKPTGEYYALLIGNSDYELDELYLGEPLRDVIALKEVLQEDYSFKKENIVLLKNANRESTFKALYDLRTKLNKNDNLLIFYAGHGIWDEQVEQGYWWPTDAHPDNPSNWLSNSDLREQIRAINTAHTLLISDACFSGGIFKTRGAEEIKKANRDIQLLYRMPSRRAITSGTLSTVPDNSVFFNYLLKYLKENQNKFMSSTELFSKVRKAVMNNSLTVPQNGVIMGTGDEGGDFIFIRKD